MASGGADILPTRQHEGQSASVVHSDDSHDEIRPEDSVSQVGHSKPASSASSSRSSAKVKHAVLRSRSSALKALQDIEMQELQLKQQRQQIELEQQLREAEAEVELEGQAVSVHNSNPGAPVDNSALNPEVSEFVPRVERDAEVIVQPYGQRQLFEALQIPKVEIMTFDGNPLKYWPFIRSFENNVEKFCIGDEARLARLMQYTVGRARQVLQSCYVMEPAEGYQRARQLLKERFGNDYVITEAWIKKINCFGTIGPKDVSKLRDFADELKCCSETLKAMDRLNEIDNQSNLLRIVDKLPLYLQNSWRKEARGIRVERSERPSIMHLTAFVEKAAEVANDPVFGVGASSRDENFRKDSSGKPTRRYEDVHRREQVSVMTSVNSRDCECCVFCGEKHQLFKCSGFQKLKVQERLEFVRSKRLCDNCLKYGHRAAQCMKPTRCTVAGCGKKHTKFLHFPVRNDGIHGEDVSCERPPVAVHGQSVEHSRNTVPTEIRCGLTGAGAGLQRVALPVVPVRVGVMGSGCHVNVCALLDSGSTGTFCSQELSNLLGIKGQKETFSLTTLDSANSVEEGEIISLEIADMSGDNVFKLPRVYTRPTLPLSMQNVASVAEVEKWPHLRDIILPDMTGLRIMMLIGQDNPAAMVCYDLRSGPKGAPYAVKTPFGWTINGPMAAISGEGEVCAHFVDVNVRLEQQVERFWRLEYNEAVGDEVEMSVNDKRAVSLWNETIQYTDGHYETAIPFKHWPPRLIDNRVVAEQRLAGLKRRLVRDPDLKIRYEAGMKDLLAKGYAEKVDDEHVDSCQPTVWYLPHHPVFHPKKPDKLRIVFDCAARYAGTSLNDQILQGPDLTNKLLGVLLRFRQDRVALMADVEGMFNQVRVRPCDRNVLRFLWWSSGDMTSVPEAFRMKTHLFGGVWSPSCCSFVLRRTADDNESRFSQAAVDTVRRNFYVDDCLKSVASSTEAVKLVEELSDLLACGGFRLTKWLSNDRTVLRSIPDNDRTQGVRNLDLNTEHLPTEHALGVKWDVESDSLGYEIVVKDRPLTRRGILSIVSSIYDPLGFVSPFILTAKKIIQELCRRSVGWDESLPDDILRPWNSWLHDLPKLSQVKVSRCMKPDQFGQIVNSQLHHFSDASRDSYGTVSYLRLTDDENYIHCSIVMAKARLAPLKQVTIPRLELSAAVLAVKVDQIIRREIDLNIDESVFWTDSTAVLKYIRNESARFQTFVANRLSVIHAGSTVSQWHHVNTKLNVADLASRGMTADEIAHSSCWFEGPEFLKKRQEEWPKELELDRTISDDDVEIRKQVSVYTTEPVASTDTDDIMHRIVNRRSSWYQLKRDICWILRARNMLKEVKDTQTCSGVKPQIDLTVDELKQSEVELLKLVQQQAFADDVRTVHQADGLKVNVKKISSLYRLEPVMSPAGLLVVGGRLNRSSLSDLSKHPVILPKSHHIVDIIVKHYHELSGHAGKEHVLSLVREQYWIINARSVVRRIVNSCVICRRYRPKPLQQRMADLPSDRVTPGDPPFTCVGIDLFGPFDVKRGRSTTKRYGCIFVCLAIKAVHIEVVSSLDTDSFINALQRFICRRGQPVEIRSDNGTNLVGAEKELRRSVAEWNQKRIGEFLAQKEIRWKFNPPAASHMGGIWERQIRSVRKILSVLLKQQCVDDEALMTLMCIVESIINSRPLTAVSDDHRDSEPLTPNHLLLLRAGPTVPPGLFVVQDVYRRRWRQVQYLADVFWKRWIKEYLPSLQLRQKWIQPSRNIDIGDVVLIVDYSVPRNTWTLARVVECFPGEDGLVRSVRVRTSTSSFVRPIHKLCLVETVTNIK